MTIPASMQILGQERVLHWIRKQWLQEGNPAGCYLFSGARGVGKATTSRWVAQQLFCPQQGCGHCQACQKLAHATHPDYIQLGPSKGVIGMEQVRALLRTMQYPPLEARLRLIVIDEAETLNSFAANAMLKTIEEPPPNHLIIFISSLPEQLPITLRSRLQTVGFAPLTSQTKATLWQAPLEKVRLWEALSGTANLSWREMLEAWESWQQRRDQIIAILTNTHQPDFKQLWRWTNQLAEDDNTGSLRLLRSILRDLLLMQQGMDPAALTHTHCHASLQKIQLPMAELLRLLASCDEVVQNLEEHHANRRIASEYLLSQLEAL